MLEPVALLLDLAEHSGHSARVANVPVLLKQHADLDGLQSCSSLSFSTANSLFVVETHLVAPEVPANVPVERVLQ